MAAARAFRCASSAPRCTSRTTLARDDERRDPLQLPRGPRAASTRSRAAAAAGSYGTRRRGDRRPRRRRRRRRRRHPPPQPRARRRRSPRACGRPRRRRRRRRRRGVVRVLDVDVGARAAAPPRGDRQLVFVGDSGARRAPPRSAALEKPSAVEAAPPRRPGGRAELLADVEGGARLRITGGGSASSRARAAQTSSTSGDAPCVRASSLLRLHAVRVARAPLPRAARELRRSLRCPRGARRTRRAPRRSSSPRAARAAAAKDLATGAASAAKQRLLSALSSADLNGARVLEGAPPHARAVDGRAHALAALAPARRPQPAPRARRRRRRGLGTAPTWSPPRLPVARTLRADLSAAAGAVRCALLDPELKTFGLSTWHPGCGYGGALAASRCASSPTRSSTLRRAWRWSSRAPPPRARRRRSSRATRSSRRRRRRSSRRW